MLLIVVGMCKTTKSIDEINRYLYTIFMKKLAVDLHQMQMLMLLVQ